LQGDAAAFDRSKSFLIPSFIENPKPTTLPHQEISDYVNANARRSNSRGSLGDVNGTSGIKLKARIATSANMNQGLKEKFSIKRAV